MKNDGVEVITLLRGDVVGRAPKERIVAASLELGDCVGGGRGRRGCIRAKIEVEFARGTRLRLSGAVDTNGNSKASKRRTLLDGIARIVATGSARIEQESEWGLGKNFGAARPCQGRCTR
jgi:hypothetical protein